MRMAWRHSRRARQTSKATPWKGGYHNGRALLHVLDRLSRLN